MAARENRMELLETETTRKKRGRYGEKGDAFGLSSPRWRHAS